MQHTNEFEIDENRTGSPNPPPLRFSMKMLLGVVTGICLLLGLVMWLGVIGVIVILIEGVILIKVWNRAEGESVWGWIAVGAVVALAACCSVFDTMGPRPSPSRAVCGNNLKQLALALRQYHTQYGSFPPAHIADDQGQPMHSWRTLILPYLDYPDVYGQLRLDEPWNSPHNARVLQQARRLEVFQCPCDPNEQGDTNFLAVVGPGTMWPDAKTVKRDDVTDGISYTILLVEVANSGIHWAEPRDLHVRQMAPTINAKAGQGLSSEHFTGVNAAFADGSIRFLPNDITADELRALLTRNGREKIDVDRLQ